MNELEIHELCIKFSFSELFFEKLKIIPVALFRIHSLLIAEEMLKIQFNSRKSYPDANGRILTLKKHMFRLMTFKKIMMTL